MANSNPLGGTGGPGHTKGVAFTTTNSPSRQRWKWELAIRFQLKNPNAKQSEVAAHIGIDAQTLSTWQADPEWTNLYNQITTGILSSIDADLAEDITHQRLTLKRLVPTAIQNLAEMALQSANPNLKLKASLEILDRDGHMSKVQRIGLASEAQGGISDQKDDDVAKALGEALIQAKLKQAESKTPRTEQTPPSLLNEITIDSASPTEEVQ